MSIESVRAFFAAKAPDIAVIEATTSSATVQLAAEAYGVEPGRIELRLGTSSTDIAAVVPVDLTGPERTIRGPRTMTAGVTLSKLSDNSSVV